MMLFAPKGHYPADAAYLVVDAAGDAELAKLAGDIPVSVLRALRTVESNGHPEAVRFEPHLFLHFWPTLAKEIPYTPSAIGPSHVRAETDRAAFEHAFRLEPEAAVESTSWGSYQILGGKLLDLEHDPVKAVELFDGDPPHVSDRLLVDWFAHAPRAAAAARRLDFFRLAQLYNGPKNAQHYADALRRAHAMALHIH